MTIKELKKLLDQYDEDLIVITDRYENLTGTKIIGIIDEHFIKLIAETAVEREMRAAERQMRAERGLK